MKWIEEKQALYKRNQELVEKVGDIHVSQSMFYFVKKFLLITQLKFFSLTCVTLCKLCVKTKKNASLFKLQYKGAGL